MSQYSLLQRSLDQSIDRESMEEASVKVTSLARADCAYLQRDLFGIVVSNLSHPDALIFQTELSNRGFLTDVVSDEELPILHSPFTIQRIEIGKDALLFTDMMGRTQERPLTDLVFIAGGFMNKDEVRKDLVQHWEEIRSIDRLHQSTFQPKIQRVSAIEFRVDFFFHTEQHRLSASVTSESLMFLHHRAIRVKDTALLLGAMMDFQELLPEERIGEGLRRSDTALYYPTLQSYEEEIRWHFYRLTQSS